MTTFTSRYGFPQITLGSDVVNVATDFNAPWATLDGILNSQLCTISTLPSAPAQGQIVLLTDKKISAINVGTSGSPVWLVLSTPNWKNVLWYGADPTGASSSSTAVASAITAAGSGGVVYFPAGTYLLTSAIVPASGIRFTGDGAFCTTIQSTTSNIFNMGPATHYDRIEIDHLAIASTGFDMFTGANIARCTIHDCILTQNSAGNYIWNGVGAALMEECVFERNIHYVYGATRTVPAWGLSGGAINQNIWQNEVCWNEGADNTQYFFDVYAATSGTQNEGNIWDNIVFENPLGGMIRLRSCTRGHIRQCLAWDISANINQSLIYLGDYSGNTSQPCRTNTVTHSGRVSTSYAFNSGASDIQLDSTTVQTTIIQPVPSATINTGGSIAVDIMGSSVGMSVTGYTPGGTAGAGAGTSPPAPIVTAGSDNRSGTVTWGTGTSPTTGNQVTVTFGQTFAVVPVVMFSNGNGPTSGLNVNIQSVTTTGFVISTGNAPAASQANTTYKIAWAVCSG
jgi:hypothetical protein